MSRKVKRSSDSRLEMSMSTGDQPKPAPIGPQGSIQGDIHIGVGTDREALEIQVNGVHADDPGFAARYGIDHHLVAGVAAIAALDLDPRVLDPRADGATHLEARIQLHRAVDAG